MLSTGEVDAADVQVSKGSCSPSWLFSLSWCSLQSLFLVICHTVLCCAVGAPGSRVRGMPCVCHVVHNCDSSDHPL